MSVGLRLGLGITAVALLIAYMAYVGAEETWRYYVTVDECLRQSGSMIGDRIRVSGRIDPGSVRTRNGRQGAKFRLRGTEGVLRVECPDTVVQELTANAEVVVEGTLVDRRTMRAERVLTRCASKYQRQADSPSRGAESIQQ